MTVGVAVLPNDAAAASAASGLSRRGWPRRARRSAAAGCRRASWWSGSAARRAGLYDYNRQISTSFTAGPYVVMYAVGYSDSRPRVPVSEDSYSDAEMTSMAAGVARFRRAHARRQPRPAALPGDTRMLTQRWRPGLALLAAVGVMSLAVLPGPARAAVRPPGGELAGSAAADGIRDEPAVGAEHAGRRSGLVGDPGRRGDRRGDRQRGEPVRQRPVRIGHHRSGLHRRDHQPGQQGLGRARHLDGVADRRARPRRRPQRGHRHRARGADPVDPGDPGSRRSALRPVRAGARRPSSSSRWPTGSRYAVAHGAQVISMSIGYSAPSGTVRAELQKAYDHGVVVIASAGNSGGPAGSGRVGQAPESFPADYPGVISVGAVDSSGAVAGFSSDNLSVQVAAPGVSVPAQGRDGQYWWVSGTSPACALVAGVAALIKSRYPRLAPDLVASALTSTTTDRPAGGYDSQVGFGIVDAAAALAKAGRTGGRPARGDQPQGHRQVPRRAPAGAGPPAGFRPARPVRAARADLAGADRRRRDPAGRAPSLTGPGGPVTRGRGDGRIAAGRRLRQPRARRGGLDPARPGDVLRRHRRVPGAPGPGPGRSAG